MYSIQHLIQNANQSECEKNVLAKIAGVSGSSVVKLGREENIAMDSLAKICNALDCKLDDIVEIVPDQTEEKE